MLSTKKLDRVLRMQAIGQPKNQMFVWFFYYIFNESFVIAKYFHAIFISIYFLTKTMSPVVNSTYGNIRFHISRSKWDRVFHKYF